MALQNGCTGQMLIDEINGMQTSNAQYQENTDNRLGKLETDGFHIGDIRHSSRDDLGDKYLLCNGDHICSYDGYGELVDMMQAHRHTNIFTSPYNNNDYGYLVDGSVIYQFYNLDNSTSKSHDVYLTIYDSYIEFINGSGKVIKISEGYDKNPEGFYAKVFKNRIFLTFNCNGAGYLLYTDIDNLDGTWEKASVGGMDSTNTQYLYVMDCTEDRLLVVGYSGLNGLLELRLRSTIDGINFKTTTIKKSIPRDYSDEVRICVIASDNSFTIGVITERNDYVYILTNDADLSKEWSWEENDRDDSIFSSAGSSVEENDDICLNVRKYNQKTTLTPKTFTVSTLPTISESTSYYTYIKAKE